MLKKAAPAENKMNTLPKSERLHSFGAIRRLFTEGHAGFIYPFRYMFFVEKSEQNSIAVLFSTPKKFHKRANKRNSLRRGMKEAYRLNKEILTKHLENHRVEVAVIYSSKTFHDNKSIENGVKKVLQAIAESL